MKRLLPFLLVFNMTYSAQGVECTSQVTYLNPGDKVPCPGYLFGIEAEKANRVKLMDYDLVKKELVVAQSTIAAKETQIDFLTKAYDDSQKQSDMWKTEAQNQAKVVSDLQDSQGRERLLWFGGGALVTILMAYAISHAR